MSISRIGSFPCCYEFGPSRTLPAMLQMVHKGIAELALVWPSFEHSLLPTCMTLSDDGFHERHTLTGRAWFISLSFESCFSGFSQWPCNADMEASLKMSSWMSLSC